MEGVVGGRGREGWWAGVGPGCGRERGSAPNQYTQQQTRPRLHALHLHKIRAVRPVREVSQV